MVQANRGVKPFIIQELTQSIMDPLNDNQYDGTKEIMGRVVSVTNITTDEVAKDLDVPTEFIDNFIPALEELQHCDVGPYSTEYYVCLHTLVQEAALRMVEDPGARSISFSRQGVFHFEEKHCFQSVQFLVRDGKVHANVFMRSCNMVRNFACDMYLISWMCDKFAACFEEETGTKLSKDHSFTVLIGSLHIFEEDMQ